MKNKSPFTLFIILLFFQLQSFSQENENKTQLLKNHEIKIDALDLVFFSALEATYEHVSDTNNSYGISAFVNFKDTSGYYEKFAIVPFYRFYFFNKEDFGAKGFFVEAFSKFASGDSRRLIDPLLLTDMEEINYFDVALGFSLGKKWVNSKGFTFEFSLGVGRNLGLDDNSPEFAFRGGFSLGYQFK